MYVAGAAVEHRRTGADARLRSLTRTAHTRGLAARRFDARRGQAPSLASEMLTLTRCVGHVVRRRCPAGLTMVAHSAGRLRQGLSERAGSVGGPDARGTGGPDARGADAPGPRGAGVAPAPAEVEDFLSGTSGTVGGLDALRRRAGDEAIDAWQMLSAMRLRLGLAARHSPPLRRVLVLGVERPENALMAAAIRGELLSSRHQVELYTCPPDGRGKFENLNLLLAAHPADACDWLLVLDDDIELPRGFLDRFVFLCERFSLALAQPAHRLFSHAAWPVTRRRARSVVRETRFVEIGPLTAFAPPTFPVLLPFPELRMGWGLDAHWAALAGEHGWRCGIVDALPIRHIAAPAAAGYPREDAVAEARAFLAERPYLRASEAGRTLTTHRSW